MFVSIPGSANGCKAMDAAEVIKLLKLETLEKEGGYFRQTYKAKGFVGNRAFSTAIYYLVTPENFSSLHRCRSDEIFHFYLGDPVEMIQITNEGEFRTITLGSALTSGEQPQALAPAEVWQGTRLTAGGKWALLGATVAPGFEYEDFELGERTRLMKLFPHLKEQILRYTYGI